MTKQEAIETPERCIHPYVVGLNRALGRSLSRTLYVTYEMCMFGTKSIRMVSAGPYRYEYLVRS
jgi:hypothetical protein